MPLLRFDFSGGGAGELGLDAHSPAQHNIGDAIATCHCHIATALPFVCCSSSSKQGHVNVQQFNSRTYSSTRVLLFQLLLLYVRGITGIAQTSTTCERKVGGWIGRDIALVVFECTGGTERSRKSIGRVGCGSPSIAVVRWLSSNPHFSFECWIGWVGVFYSLSTTEPDWLGTPARTPISFTIFVVNLRCGLCVVLSASRRWGTWKKIDLARSAQYVSVGSSVLDRPSAAGWILSAPKLLPVPVLRRQLRLRVHATVRRVDCSTTLSTGTSIGPGLPFPVYYSKEKHATESNNKNIYTKISL